MLQFVLRLNVVRLNVVRLQSYYACQTSYVSRGTFRVVRFAIVLRLPIVAQAPAVFVNARGQAESWQTTVHEKN